MREKLLDNLFSEEYTTYVILDGAADNIIHFKVKYFFDVSYQCLYRGQDKEELEEVAPYLVECRKNSEFTNWVLDNYGKNFGVFIQSTHNLAQIHDELSARTKIIDEETGNNLFIRFYDPRAILKYFKIQTSQQGKSLFSIVPIFLYENYKNNLELYKTVILDNTLSTTSIKLKKS